MAVIYSTGPVPGDSQESRKKGNPGRSGYVRACGGSVYCYRGHAGQRKDKKNVINGHLTTEKCQMAEMFYILSGY